MRKAGTILCAALVLAGAPFAAGSRAEPTGMGDFSAWSAGKPQTGLRVTTATLHTADGGKHAYKVEIAETGEQQAMGMMFRKEMARDTGMLFPMDPPRRAGFYMRNTYVPLDIIFIGADGRVLNIGSGRPLDETVIPSEGLAKAVLELRAGEARRIGLRPGDRIDW